MVSPHFTRAGAFALAVTLIAGSTSGTGQQVASSSTAASSFKIFLRGTQVGTEQIAVESTPQGVVVTGSGQIGPPLDLTLRSLRVRYGQQSNPRDLTMDVSARGQMMTLRSEIAGTTVTSTLTASGTATPTSDAIEETALLLLAGPFFAPYEAVAARLRSAEPGATLPVYVPGQGSTVLRVGESAELKIQTIARLINARRTAVTLDRPNGPPLTLDIWADEAGRLLRVSAPVQNLDAVREDIASVSARTVAVSREGDEQVRVPANGFSLAGTISKPADAGRRPLPAIVLVGGSGPTDRDETISGVPVLGQLANALADAGYLVLRYDKRGVGQSGGRAEAATIGDYSEDLRAAVRFLSRRSDVDRRRLAVAGHGEGGAVAMLAADRENRIKVLVLIATPGMTGAELNLAQVARASAQSNRSASEQQASIELQKEIQAAVLTGTGWDDIEPAIREQADVPWFRSFLAFDPIRVMRGVDQPVLIVQPMLDTQVPPVNADRLETAARARRRTAAVEVLRLPGLNHLLVPAQTGEPVEYRTLTDRNVSPAVATSIAGLLERVWES